MILSNILALPPTIILTIFALTSSATGLQRSHNPAKRSTGQHDEGEFVKRALNIKRRMQVEKPIGVKKMSTDEGEMFMLDDWIFASDLGKRTEQELYGNGTSEALSPLRPLEVDDFFSRLRIRAALSKRQFACPAGTNSCAAIGAPDVCCGSGSNCVNVNNSPGVGSVGCCPQGQSCAGPISCDTNAGYSSCPNSPNGGCCLPGYACAGIGCAVVRTSTAFPPPPSTTPTPSPSPSSTAIIVVPTSPSTTPTLTPTSSPSPSSTYRTQTSTQAPSAPIRPTSGTMMSSSTVDVCPQGFYVCSAYYPSGACCRVGRDCMSTGSCDVPPSSTIINTNGVVVVAPTGAGVATGGASQRGSCPSAWYSCPAQQGGNCCPEGYGCGEVCTATASDKSGSTQKVAPSQATFVSTVSIWTMLVTFFATGVAMLAL